MKKETDKTLRIRAVKLAMQFLIDDLEILNEKIEEAFLNFTEDINTKNFIGEDLAVLEKELKLLRG